MTQNSNFALRAARGRAARGDGKSTTLRSAAPPSSEA